MAEALALAASVIALIQLTNMVTETASTYVSTVKGVHSTLMPLISNVENLRSILIAIQKQLEVKASDRPGPLVLQVLEQPLNVCQSIMRRIHVRLEKVTIVGGCAIGMILDKRTTADVKHLYDLIHILQLALDADNLASVHALERELQSLRLDVVDQALDIRNDVQALSEDVSNWKSEIDFLTESSGQEKDREKVLDWLAYADPEGNHVSAYQKRQPGTGSWLLKSTDFVDWEAGRTPHLWLGGMAGAGKTVLCSTVIRHLVARHGESNVAYFYFDFRDNAKQDVLSLLASWTAQIVRSLRPLPNGLVKLFQRHCVRDEKRPSPPTVYELTKVLNDVKKLKPTLFLVVDALDECQQRSSLLETLSTLLEDETSCCRTLCTSRAEPDIQRTFSKFAAKEICIRNDDVDRDVALHIRSVLDSDERLRGHRQGTKDLIEKELTRGAKGMFRWVRCQLDHIRTLRTARDIKLALRNLPPDLDRTYEDILQRVPPADFYYLHQALQFIVFSARPMTLAEVAEAVIIEPGIGCIDEDDRLQRPEDLLDMGKSLFAQDQITKGDKQLLELSHYSVKEYLLSDRTSNGPAARFYLNKTTAQTNISICCLTYLGLDAFESAWQEIDIRTWARSKSEILRSDEDLLISGHLERLTMYPFLEYSAKHLFNHCRDEGVQKTIAPMIRETFSIERSRSFRNMTYTCVFKTDDDWESMYVRVFRYSLLTIAAMFGLRVVVQDLLDHGVPADYICPRPLWMESDEKARTTLCHAAEIGHEHICRMLISAGASLDGFGGIDCPLSAAGRSENPAIVRLILDAGADVHRNTTSIALTLLISWWKFAEGDTKRKQVCEIFKEAGASWVTIGLLQAFSRVGAQVVRRTAELLAYHADEAWDVLSVADLIRDAEKGLEDSIWVALQWLVQDKDGVAGLMSLLEKILLALYKSQPQLLRQDSKSFTQKYNTEEVLAENMTHIYFTPLCSVDYRPATTFQAAAKHRLLTMQWKNKCVPDSTTPAAWDDHDLIVCGPLLRAFIRDRWDSSYTEFYD